MIFIALKTIVKNTPFFERKVTGLSANKRTKLIEKLILGSTNNTAKMKIYAYLRVSTDNQDIDKQKHLMLEYAQQNRFIIDQFISSEMSSMKTQVERKIDILLSELEKGDKLIVAELSRLGRNMLEVLNLIEALNKKGVEIIFIRQPEISTNSPHTKLLFAIYSYFAQSEREFIALRTKQGLAAAKAKGVILGRPKGSKSHKGRVLDPYKDQINNYIALGVSINSIMKLINPLIKSPLSYNTYKDFTNSLKTTNSLNESAL